MSTIDPTARPDILTYTGRYFNFLNPQNNEYDIRDIAHALSNVCRFAGHVREFYSVAQHSVMVARICVQYAGQNYIGDVNDRGRAGLLHDASEAYLGDVTRPLKKLLPDYKQIEQSIERALFAKFGIPYPLPEIVKHADLVMLATEQRDLMAPHADEWPALAGITPLPEIINPWSPEKAEREFLNMSRILMLR